MTGVYIATLIFGGVFVLLSVLGGIGDADVDVDADADFDVDVDADADFDVDADADVDVDADTEGLGDVEAVPQRKFRPWFSFKFYSFATCFFGLTGVALTQLVGMGEPVVGGISAGMGLFAGLFVTYLMHRIDQSALESKVAGQRQFLGAQAEVLLPVKKGSVGRVRVRLDDRTVDMRAEPADEDVVLDSQEECFVLDIDEGVVHVAGADVLKSEEERS